MSHSYNCITLDSPNIPLTCARESNGLPFGEFIPHQSEEMESLLGPVKSQDMYLPNFTIRAFEGKMSRDAVFCDQHGQGLHMLGSCIFLKGQIKTFIPGRKDGLVSFNRSQNCKFDPHNEFRHLCLADTHLNFIHFSFMPHFFNQLLPENEPWAEKLRAKIEKKERFVGDHFTPISLPQEQALANIFNTPLTGKLGYMMIETSIIQLLLLQIYSLFNRETTHKPSISKRDLEVIHELKDYLNKSFLEDHSICGLAYRFGVNSNKLMSLFKNIFGKSIFEYITDHRMDYARRLLREEGMQIIEVSRTVGYKNPNHFSTAFKKKFGINPSSFK